MATSVAAKPVVLFDGVCNLCNGFVTFLIERDPEAGLRFGSLQSGAAREMLGDVSISSDADNLETIVFVEPGDNEASGARVSIRSDAVFRIAGYLPRPWRWVRFLGVIPRPIRDAVYSVIVRNRYRLFGRRDTCRVPTPEEANRFIDQGVCRA